MWNERYRITSTEIQMGNLGLGMKCSFSKINSTFFCPAFFYFLFINTLLKVASKNFKRLLLVRRFEGFFMSLEVISSLQKTNVASGESLFCGFYVKDGCNNFFSLEKKQKENKLFYSSLNKSNGKVFRFCLLVVNIFI